MDWNIQGHDWAQKLLRAHAAGSKLRHAYLFTGPEGVGRRTLALRFAQMLNCTGSPSKESFCTTCRDCRQISAMIHPDLSVLLPEEGHKDILIDQVRSLQHTLALSPYTARYRIALLPNFQRATTQAANALLKTLEEPPDKVVLLLTATSLEGLLPTIVSRCELLRLRPASIAETRDFLGAVKGLTSDKASLLAHLSGGRIGAAIQLIEDPAALSRRREQLNRFLQLLSARRFERFKLAEELSTPYNKARQNAAEAISIWLSFWRDVFVCSSGGAYALVNIDFADQVGHIATLVDAKSARELVVAHENALHQVDLNANIRLLLEVLMLQWPIVSAS